MRCKPIANSMPHAVLDAPVRLSACLTRPGVSNERLQQAAAGALLLYRSPHERVTDCMEGLRDLAHLGTDRPAVTAVPRDPPDAPIVATAMATHASDIIPRDEARRSGRMRG